MTCKDSTANANTTCKDNGGTTVFISSASTVLQAMKDDSLPFFRKWKGKNIKLTATPKGTFGAYEVEVGDQKFILKPIYRGANNHNPVCDVLAYGISDLLKLDVMPPYQYLEYEESPAVLCNFLHGCVDLNETCLEDKTYQEIFADPIFAERLAKIAILDEIVANSDGNFENLMVNPETHELWAIDRSMAQWEDDGCYVVTTSLYDSSRLNFSQEKTWDDLRYAVDDCKKILTYIPQAWLNDWRWVSYADWKAVFSGFGLEDDGACELSWQRLQRIIKDGTVDVDEVIS